jgi:CheY-like chemotaxis protein
MSDGLINLDVKRLVLVTDDEASIRRSLQLLLHAKGYDAHCYTTASALLADHEARSADCIIADYNMPDIDGISLLKRLETGWRGDAILITAYCSDDLTRRARLADMQKLSRNPLSGGPSSTRCNASANVVRLAIVRIKAAAAHLIAIAECAPDLPG